MRPLPLRQGFRPTALAALAVIVTLAHLLLANDALDDALLGAPGSGARDGRPRRMEVSFVRELAPAAPPLTPPVAATPAARRAALAPVPAASAPKPAPKPELKIESIPVPLLAALEPAPQIALAPEPAPPIIEAAAAELPTPAPPNLTLPEAVPAASFEWPPSTRLSYTLTGNYRGPVDGQARVEWLLKGTRYQVHLEVSVGPAVAPLLARRMSSDGELTAQGLRPSRYDEETRVLLKSPRQVAIIFDDQQVRLPAGNEVPRPDGLQDSASQFGQLTWLFTTRPELLQKGRSIDIPLALPRRVSTWTYAVLETESLQTPAGPIEAVHVKPRRESRSANDLSAEMWIAPSLQYLPVRIVIRQDEQNWVDLLLLRLPQQTGPTGPTSPTTRP